MRNAWVYRSSLGDCSNGGVSSRETSILILGVHEPAPEKVTDRHFREENRSALTGGTKDGEPTYWAAVPLLRPPDMAGPMYGGNLAIAEHDGAACRVYRIHDRFETWEAREILSR